MSRRVPTMEQARAIWRAAIFATVAERGIERVPPRVGEWHAQLVEMAAWLPTRGTRRGPRPGHVYSDSPAAVKKRRARERPEVWQRERDAAELVRRQQGALPRAERDALTRAAREATRAEREAARKAKRDAYREQNREVLNERQRQRRAAMTLEERRAEWNRYQRAKRARDRASRAARATYAEAAE